jgi:AcrR family transcriptional regulator
MEEAESQPCPVLRGCKRGRPRSEAARRAILGAANALLARDGFQAVTVEAIAAEAGVGKATVYRWWPCKAAVLMDAFLAVNGPCPRSPDTGCLREDLRRQIGGLAEALNGPFGTILAGIVAEAQADPDAAAAFRALYLAPRRAEAKQALARGQARGEIRAGADLDAATDALYGPLLFRLLTGHAPLTPCFANSLIALVLDGLRPDSSKNCSK